MVFRTGSTDFRPKIVFSESLGCVIKEIPACFHALKLSCAGSPRFSEKNHFFRKTIVFDLSARSDFSAHADVRIEKNQDFWERFSWIV